MVLRPTIVMYRAHCVSVPGLGLELRVRVTQKDWDTIELKYIGLAPLTLPISKAHDSRLLTHCLRV